MDEFFHKINMNMFQENKDRLYGHHLYTLLQHAHVTEKCRFSINNNIKINVTPEREDTKYFDLDIQNNIATATKSCDQLTIRFINRTITINFISINGNKIEISDYVEYLLLWFKLMNAIANKENNKHLTVTIYATPYKKVFPHDSSSPLTSKHINSAFTYPCRESGLILIYREEEWFKVLLHESIHSFCLDFSLMDQDVIRDAFRVNNIVGAYVSEPAYSETYTELWAELLQAGLLSFFQAGDKELFSLYFDFYCQLEYIHSVSVVRFILDHYSLSFNELREKHHIDQTTHVFEYYILKCILLSDYNAFLEWCLKKNGQNMIPFHKTEATCVAFCDLINQCFVRCNFDEIKKGMPLHFNDNTLAMSLIEIV